MTEFSPAFILLAAAAALWVLPSKARAVLCVAAPLLGLWHLLGLEIGAKATASLAGFELTLLEVTALNNVFGIIFLLISAAAGIYAWHLEDRGQQIASTAYAAGALGVTFAGDFLTLLLFWELMAVASAWLIFARRQPESNRAGFRYLIAHFAGGSALFGGIILFYGATGTLALQPLSPETGFASWLILIGVALNVALPPLHPWLPDAYPKATVTGAVFMSALTTKSAVYVLLVLFPGWELLIYMGLMMTLYGVVYAVLANDIRQILSYHIISQVGFMVTGVGLGTALSMNGTAAHAYSHILYKALLFMGAGAVIQATGVSRLSELGGLSRKMRPLVWLFMIGAFSISGFPLLNGFISKSMIITAAGKVHYDGIMLGLLFASVGTFLSIALKIPAAAFWGPDRKLEIKPLPKTMYLAMGLVAFGCVFYGIFPGALYSLLPYDAEYQPYTAYHFVESSQILTFTFIGFWVVRSKLAGKPYIALDTDWFYRRGAPVAQTLIVKPINAFFGMGAKARDGIASFLAGNFGNPRAWFGANRGPSDGFDPDLERAPMSTGLAFILLVFVGLFASIVLFA